MLVTAKILEGWLAQRYFKDAWRLRSWTQQDYLQEGYCIYLAMEQHYAEISQPAHLMALFKTAWWRHIHDKASKERTSTTLDAIADQTAETPLDLGMLDWQAEHMQPADHDSTYWSDWLVGELRSRSHCGRSDAHTLFRTLTAPTELLNMAVSGIIFTHAQVRALSKYLNWTPQRVRHAASQLIEEFTMPSAIQLLATATGTQPKANEERQAYLTRLVESVASLTDEDWGKVPRVAQDYYNASAEALNKGEPLPDMADEAADGKSAKAPKIKAKAPSKGAADKAAKAAATAVNEAAIKGTPAAEAPSEAKPEAAAAETPAEKPAEAAPAKPAAKAKTTRPKLAEGEKSPTGRAREIMTLNSEITSKATCEQLTAEGFALPSLSAIQAMRSDIRQVLRILRENNLLK